MHNLLRIYYIIILYITQFLHHFGDHFLDYKVIDKYYIDGFFLIWDHILFF